MSNTYKYIVVIIISIIVAIVFSNVAVTKTKKKTKKKIHNYEMKFIKEVLKFDILT